MPSKCGLIVAFVLTIAVAAGAILFTHALDPGRAEASGVVLNLLVDRGQGAEANDWFSGQQQVLAARAHGYLIVRGGPTDGFQLISRPLPVYPDRRYVVLVRLRAKVRGTLEVAVGDEDATQYLAVTRVPAGPAPRVTETRFSSGSRRRIAIVLAGTPHVLFELVSARLALVR